MTLLHLLGRRLAPALLLAGLLPALHADNLADGVAYAVPVPAGKAPVIDGHLDEWDLSGAEPCWIGLDSAAAKNAVVAYAYDQEALYVGAEVTLPGRPLKNPNRPVDRFWDGDLLQLRVSSDPQLPFPLPQKTAKVLADNPRVLSINLWKNTATGEDFVQLQFGAALNLGDAVNPPGTQIKILPRAGGYTLEAKLPWSALRVPDGKMPFAAGQRMTAIMEVLWGGGDEGRTTMHFHQDPGTFGFQRVDSWGQIEFSATGKLKPRHDDLAAIIRRAQAGEAPTGTPVRFDLPARAKVTVNIFDDHGAVLRELMGGEWHDAGPVTAWWDGRNQWGEPLPPGQYHWGAYVHQGLDVTYVGTVGTAGAPPYETADGKGAWGGDHGPPIDAAADRTGWYFAWNFNESGRSIVKTDFKGQVQWRVSPFVAGGYGGYSAIAANGQFVYLVIDNDHQQQLVKLDAATGSFLPFPDGGNTKVLHLYEKALEVPPAGALVANWARLDKDATSLAFTATGLACDATRVYVSDFPGNRVVVLDAASGDQVGELACPGARGVCLSQGALYVACYLLAANKGTVARFDLATGKATTVVDQDLEAPWDVAVDGTGNLHVSDLGASQQVKVFGADGKLLRRLGKASGRPYLGRYVPTDFRNPAGLAWDGQGGILVAEASAPKVFTRLDAATGKILQQWYGYTAYSPSNVPDSDDPRLQYYSLSGPNSFARARLPDAGGLGLPDASWDFVGSGDAAIGSVMDTMVMPEVIAATNGRKYLVGDADSRAICLIDGDQMRPVASAQVKEQPKATPPGNCVALWVDANGDGRQQPEEVTMLTQVEGRPVRWAAQTGSMAMGNNGDLFLTTMNNAVVLVPATGFAADGSIRWDASKARFAIPKVLDRVDQMYATWRLGVLGVRRDQAGNFFLAFSTTAPYATPALTKRMAPGMGHTSEVNTIKIAKYDPAGKLLWMAGRKALASPRPGEIMHHWIIGGLIADQYVVSCSEWGTFAVYTADGYYVDTLFDLPGKVGRGVPYTFGGEDFSGQVRYFPQRDEVWAYNAGHSFRVTGFSHGRVVGEQRLAGTMELTKVEPLPGEARAAEPLPVAPLAGDAADASTWAKVPARALAGADGELATFQFAYSPTDLHVRAQVHDPTPLVNRAENLNGIFKGGDSVGFELGPAVARTAKTPVVGMTRFLAAKIGGQARLVAMKPLTALAKKPDTFGTTSGGNANFEYLGEVPGGAVTLTPDADGQGYTCLARIPLAFLEVDFKAGAELAVEAEVLLSGQGGSGVGTVSRHYLFAPSDTHTTMVNDTPTEARLYPQGWGVLQVK